MSIPANHREDPARGTVHASGDEKNDGAFGYDQFTNSGATSLQSTITFTPEEEARVVRKVDWALLPGLTFLYLLSFLDRSNVGNAKLLGMLTDIHVKDPSNYNTALALYFLGYVLFEVPANIVLKRYNPRKWLPILVVAFGITSTLQGVITNKAGFYAGRFFLGVSEAGLFAGCVFVFSMYYKRNERHWRVALFFGGAAIAGAFGGVLAWGIGHIANAGAAAWSYVFFIEGIFSTLVGVSAFWWVPDYPRQASFLNEREKEILLARLALDSDAADSEAFSWEGVIAAHKDPLVWGYAFLFHAFAFPLYSLSLFLPTIIAQLGYASYKAQLLTIPPYATAFLAIIFVAYGSHKTSKRGLWIILSGLVAIIGYAVILGTHTPGARYGGIFVAVIGVYSANALLLSWPSENIGGQTKRATGGAMQIFIGDIGAIAGVLVYRPSLNANFFHIPHLIAIGYILFGILVAGSLWFTMGRLNNQRAAAISESGREEGKLGAKHRAGENHAGDGDVSYVYQL